MHVWSGLDWRFDALLKCRFEACVGDQGTGKGGERVLAGRCFVVQCETLV